MSVAWGNENPDYEPHEYSDECKCFNCEIKREKLIEDARDILEEMRNGTD